MKPLFNTALILSLSLAACVPMQEKDREKEQSEASALGSKAMQVKTQLINQAPTAAAAVQVKQRGGKLVLTGFADSEAQKRQLEQIARQAAGGQAVVNELQVR